VIDVTLKQTMYKKPFQDERQNTVIIKTAKPK